LPTRCMEDLQDSSSEYDSLPEVSVLDVYDLASDIGKEFEKIISVHGNEFVQGLMPKVICVLELLEKISSRVESERQTIELLRTNVTLLEHEKREKAVDRLRYEKEIEQLEENWKKESTELLSMISRLQDDNRKLSSSLKEREEQNVPKSPVRRDPNWDLFEKMRDSNEKHREQLRVRDKEYQDKMGETESLHSQLERLTESNKELRRKHSQISHQMRALVEERADLQASLQEQSRNVTALNKRLGLAQRDNQDLVQSQNEVPDLTNKIVIDVNDPNRPRFTIAELKEILCERNELKARVSDLVDELSLYRSKSTCSSSTNFSSSKVVSREKEDQVKVEEATPQLPTDEFSDLPVQGPLPFEPDDAPWKRSSSKKDTGIRKLFSTLSSLPRFLAPRTVDGVL